VGMEMIFKALYNFAISTIILDFVLVTILIKKRKIYSKCKYLFFYLLSMLTFITFLEIKRFMGFNKWNFIESFCLIQSFAHFLFLTLFILNDDIKKMKKKSVVISTIFIFFLFAFSIYLDHKYQKYYSVSLANFGLIVISIIYLKKLLKSNPEIDLKKSPTFLIAIGTFISSGISMPIFLFARHLKMVLDLNTFLLVASFAPLATIVLHSFMTYSFAILWNTKK
jgi:hypothetical protein